MAALDDGFGDDIRVPIGHPPVLFSTPSAKELEAQILAHLSWKPGKVYFKKFANNEISVKIEQNCSNCDVFVLCTRNELVEEVNFNMMQLLMMLDALRSEAPYRITVVLPCLEYARQDRKMVAGEGIPPKLFLRCMQTAGADRFLTVDLHNQAEVGFSPAGCVLDELSSDKYLADFIRNNVPGFSAESTLVCATNGGGMKFTRHMADELRVGFVMADRFRGEGGGQGEVRIISENPDLNKISGIVIIDDMYDTCGNLLSVAQALRAFAPKTKIYAVGCHGYFSGEACQKIKAMQTKFGLEWIGVTNSIVCAPAIRRFDAAGLADALRVVDISRLLAGAIIRIHLGHSVNLPKFRSLGPSSNDPMLEEAGLVPTTQFMHERLGSNGADPQVDTEGNALKKRRTVGSQ